MHGGCACGNLQFAWRNIDFSLVPRACTCDYCRAQSVAWLSKSGTALAVTVRSEALHRVTEQGSGQACFHECASCEQLVWVDAHLGGERYGAVNCNCLRDRARFPAARDIQLTELTAAEKLARWQQNWCCPVTLSQIGGRNG